MKKLKKKLLIITTGRSDYGLLKPLILELKKNKKIISKLVITGTHLSFKHGMTVNEIKKDKINIFKKLKTTQRKNNEFSIAKSFSLNVSKLSNVFEKYLPNMVIVLGDKYETLANVTAALCYRIPIGHIHGGEITRGAIDDSIRHAISKLSHVHFVSTIQSRNNLIQMGEDKKNIHVVGGLGVEPIKKTNFIKKEVIEKKLNIQLSKKNILVTFNPETIEKNQSKSQIKIILESLKKLNSDTTIIFTMSIADHENEIIKKQILNFVENNTNSYFFNSLGDVYLSLLKHVDLVIGNSSSGILEAPYLKTPTINIGRRQDGREFSRSVFGCNYKKKDILAKINYIFNSEKKIKYDQLFGSGKASKKIVKIIERCNFNKILKKSFKKI